MWERERAGLEREVAVQKVRLEDVMARLAERDKEVAKLEKLLQEERAESKRFFHMVDSRNNNIVEGVTSHMAKSHQTAMQTLQSTQQISAQVIQSTLGQGLVRLREKGAKVKLLMPPMPSDMTKPESKQQFHRQVAQHLTQRVPNMAQGTALQAEIDKAIADCQTVLEEERRRLTTTLTTAEIKELHATLEEQENHLEGLRFERSMLAEGLAKFAQRNQLPPPPHQPVAATVATAVDPSKMPSAPVEPSKPPSAATPSVSVSTAPLPPATVSVPATASVPVRPASVPATLPSAPIPSASPAVSIPVPAAPAGRA